ncbi:MerR family transcriptional regulator [Cellulomonas sp. NPDC089187]|uniref:MerR family transcriptional regulator n=1 Tax=Cellulomonas sp. NPDC089187 TaxID=3154970 RepID=UPI00341F31C7
MDHDGLLRIGLFSRLTFISVRMLRHYAERGVLVPAEVDEFTGYRFYRVDQLDEARLVTGLRDAGFGVEGIAQVLAARRDPASVAALVSQQRERLLTERDGLESRLAALDRLRIEETMPTIEVIETTLPAMTVLALRDTLASYSDEGLLWQRLMPVAGPHVRPDALFGATFYDEQFQAEDADVEVWIQVPAPVVSPAVPVVCQELPERRIVAATLRGSYEGMGEVTAALGAHIAERGLRTGPMFNVYRVGPTQDPDPAHWVTEVCFPVIG